MEENLQVVFFICGDNQQSRTKFMRGASENIFCFQDDSLGIRFLMRD